MSKTTMLKTDLEIKEPRFFFQTQNLRESEYTVKDSSDLTEWVFGCWYLKKQKKY